MRKLRIAYLTSYFLGDPKAYSLENRIFNAVMILVSITGSIATIYNIILNNHIILTACSATSVVFTSIAYRYSRKTRLFQHLVTPIVVYFIVIMIVSWISNDGTKGAGADFFFLLMSIGILLLKKPFPVFYIVIVTTLVGLLLIEFFYPAIFIGYETGTQRFLDAGISLILCLIFNGIMIHVVFREYLKERTLKDVLLAQIIKDKEDLEKAHMEIKILKGIIPICASCKMIRDKRGEWNHLEDYIDQHSEATFTHGICPNCTTKLYPELQQIENDLT